MEDSHNHETLTQKNSPQKGGLRTMPFIIVNGSFERLATYGLMPNMILYLIKGYHMKSATANVIVTLWSALINFLSVFGAFISDSYFGKFRVITLGSVSSLLGMILLWSTAMIPKAKPALCNSSVICKTPTAAQLALLLSSFSFMSIGAGCIRPCSIAFGADQLVEKENVEKNARVLESYLNWNFASTGVSAILAMTLIVYIQDHFGWQVGFGVPTILMFFSASFFFLGSSLYVRVKADKSLYTGLAQVLVAAFKNRHLALPPDSSEEYYSHKKGSKFVAPSDKLRFLNKACILGNQEEEMNPDGTVSNPWKLCIVDTVEELKSFFSVIPIWSTAVLVYVTVNQPSIVVLQASSMNRNITSNFEIPAGSFFVFVVLTITIWGAFYDRVVIPLMTKYTQQQRGFTPPQRMGIGIVISCMAMALAAVVESIRRRTAIEEGLVEDPMAVVNMSAMWLVSQLCLIGLAEALNAVGQIETYFSRLPKSMSSMAMAIFTLRLAVGDLVASLIITIVNNVTKSEGRVSWLSSNLNRGHYDYYYGILGFLSLLNFVYFLFRCQTNGVSEEGRAQVSDEREV